MHIVEIDTQNNPQVKKFLELPFRLYADVPQWVPPMAGDAKLMLDRRRYPFYQHSEAAFFLAEDPAGRAAGRLAVLNNNNFNAFNREKTAFFYLFECENDPDTAHALFEAGFQWARDQGLTKITGPKGFTVFDGLGLLVKGFEHRPAFGLPYHLPYYAHLVEGTGFTACNELVSGYLNSSMHFPEQIFRLAEKLKERRGLRVSKFQSRNDLRAFASNLKELYNGALANTTGNTPLTDEEVDTLAKQMIWFADPHLVKIVYNGNEPVGFLLAYPDISAALQRSKGKLFPFGWLHLLFELKRTKWINVNGAGIIDRYRGLGGTALLFSEMYKSVIEEGYVHADIVQIGVENDRMQRELRDLGIEFYKTHRVYERILI